MLKVLQAIKKQAAAKNGEKDFFLDAQASVSIKGNEVHAFDHCQTAEDAPAITLSLREILKFQPECECMNERIYQYSNSGLNAPLSILKTLYSLRNILDYEKFSARGPRKIKDLEAVMTLFEHCFKDALSSFEDLSKPISDWLRIKKNYPNGLSSIPEAYFEEVAKIHQKYLPEALANSILVSLLAPSNAKKPRYFKAQLKKERLSSRRILCSLSSTTVEEIIASGLPPRDKFLKVVLFSAVKEQVVAGGKIVTLPPKLAQHALLNGMIEDSRNFVEVDIQTLPAESLMTIDALHSSGMRLDEAIISAQKLG